MAFPILAELPNPTDYASLGWIIAGVFGVVGLANQGMALWDRLFPRKLPPDHEVYATRTQVAKLEQDVEDEMKRIEGRFEEWLEQQARNHKEEMNLLHEWRNTMGQWQMNMERAIGHVETKADIALGKRRSPGG